MGSWPLKGAPAECSETGTSLVGSLGNSLAECWSQGCVWGMGGGTRLRDAGP